MRRPVPYAVRLRSGSARKSAVMEKESPVAEAVVWPTYNLPKKYLSYSAIMLWQKDKRAFRDRYYMGIKMPETPYMIFGKKIARMLEESDCRHDPVLSKIPRAKTAEYQIEIEVQGIKVLAYLDGFTQANCSFIEYKTGILSPKGEVPWDRVKVAKHDQLPFYHFLIKKKHRKAHQYCRLVWMETRWKTKEVEFDGMMLEGQSQELELTGRIEIFTRRITSWEHKRIEEMIVSAAKEISEDFTKWQASQKTL